MRGRRRNSGQFSFHTVCDSDLLVHCEGYADSETTVNTTQAGVDGERPERINRRACGVLLTKAISCTSARIAVSLIFFHEVN